ncbi:MAG: ATP-binding cassette domain-containing protein, partial [Candidatus Aquicultor sp.]
ELRIFRKEKVRYVFQDTMNSFDHLKTIRYYFDLLAKDKSEIEELTEYFLLPDLKSLYKMYPYEVSGGMAQRISFILALLSHPEIIILDEPTSGIDSAIANLFLLKLKEFTRRNKNSVLLVTQDISFAEKASDEIAYLVNGVLSQL